jgi:DNA helicase-2/ATP-dependent DNA helicase PcrA
MEDGIFPHLRSLGDPVELEEERRLCYVGITRAERFLSLSHAWSRTLFGSPSSNIPSRFLNEIPDELVRDVGSSSGRSFGSGGYRSESRSFGRRGEDDDGGGTPGRSVFGRGTAVVEGEFDANGRRRRAPASTGAEALGLEVGDRVVHGKWGEGTVLETSGAGEDVEAVVQFGSVGRKKLLLRMAPVKRA